MQSIPLSISSCIQNPISIGRNKSVGVNNIFKYYMIYPTIYNIPFSYTKINPSVLQNINNIIYTDIISFRDGLFKQSVEYNKDASKNNLPYLQYISKSNYKLGFNKNYILSIPLLLHGYLGENKSSYEILYNYNYNLATGNKISLSDLFKPDIDYKKLINDYIKSIIANNPDKYYPNTIENIEITDAQSFYLLDKGIVIYFGQDEITPYEQGIPQFIIPFKDFSDYIKDIYLCNN